MFSTSPIQSNITSPIKNIPPRKASPQISVLVVDDSPFMRSLLSELLSTDPDIVVVGEAENAKQARSLIKQLNPDVLTLDIEMPGMNGLDFLEKIMTLRPMPVIMVSNLTAAGADITLRALELGAVDYICKPQAGDQGQLQKLASQLSTKIKTAASAHIAPHRPLHKVVDLTDTIPPVQTQSAMPFRSNCLIAIGASTGGVEAIRTVLEKMPLDAPPVIIVLHISHIFTERLADRLNQVLPPKVVLAKQDTILRKGHIYVAPGGSHLQITANETGQYKCHMDDSDPINHHKPAIDVLFRSLAQNVGNKAIGVILTGMGADGAEGLLEMKQAGAMTIGQDKASATVYGMPRVAWEKGAVEKQVSLTQICSEILTHAK